MSHLQFNQLEQGIAHLRHLTRRHPKNADVYVIKTEMHPANQTHQLCLANLQTLIAKNDANLQFRERHFSLWQSW
jgi:hypothetical protein